MGDVVATLIELKPGASRHVQDWARYINEHYSDAVATLRAEGVTIESWFAVNVGGKEYLLCYMRAESIEQAHQVAGAADNHIDAFHNKFKEDAWVKGGHINADLLVDLTVQG